MTNLWYLNARRYSFLVECYARSTLKGQLAPIVVCAWCYLGHIDMVRCMVILEDKHWKACLLCMPVLLCTATTNMPYQTVFNHRCTRSLVNYLVTSHIDYCNSLLNGIPKTTMNKLQNVQNTATRLFTRTSHRSHITPVLKDLHWLPIQYRIQFEILVITYKAVHGQSHLYIKNLLQVYTPTINLQSQNNATALEVPENS